MIKITTESDSKYNNLETMSVKNLLNNINKEDKTVAQKIKKIIPSIEKITKVIINKMKQGGRLFYILQDLASLVECHLLRILQLFE